MASSLIDAVRPHLPTDLDWPAYLGEHDQQDLLQALAAVPDPRARRGVRYKLASLLAVAVCAVLAGASTFAAIADGVADLDPPARRRLGFAGRLPVGSTVWRFLVRVDATVLQAVLTGWLRCRFPARAAAPGRAARVVIAVAGKRLRGARLPAGRQVHLLSAYDTATGIVLAEVCVEAKSNEIPAFAPLLNQVQARLGSLGRHADRRRRDARPGRARPRGDRPGWAPDGHGQGQPAPFAAPAAHPPLGAGAGRAPHP